MSGAFTAVMAGLAGNGGVRKRGLAYRGKSQWRSLDSEWYRDPDERGGTRVGIMDRGGRVSREVVHPVSMHAIEKSTSYSGLQKKCLWLVFLISGMGKHHRWGLAGDPEAKSYVFILVVS